MRNDTGLAGGGFCCSSAGLQRTKESALPSGMGMDIWDGNPTAGFGSRWVCGAPCNRVLQGGLSFYKQN